MCGNTSAFATPVNGANAEISDQIFDYVIVGAGAAGSVLAARLSEDPVIRIALLEAGADVLPGQEHPDVLDPLPIGAGVPGLSWPGLRADITVQPSTDAKRRSKAFTQGKGIGGGSMINGSFAFRGQPEDYDGWVQNGATGWGWQDVLPYFRKLEADLDIDGPLHGTSGPMPVRREARSAWAPFSGYLAEIMLARGYPWLDDYNGQFEDGCASPPMANLPQKRIPTSSAYLTHQVRQRRNLSILTRAEVRGLLFEGARVTGVEAILQGSRVRLLGTEVILCCGAIFTPALLQRSGIGPAEAIKAAGLAPRVNLPGVGRGLKNHPKIDVAFHLPKSSRQRQDNRTIGQVCLRYSSDQPECRPHDMGLVAINRTSWHALGDRIGALMIALYQPKSEGSVRVTGPGGQISEIAVTFGLLDHDDDFARLRGGLAKGLRLLAGAREAGLINTIFMPDPKLVARLQPHTRTNALAAHAIGALLDNGLLRSLALHRSALEATTLADERTALESILRQHTGLSHHVSCTCKMGAETDPMAVLTPDCRVRGVPGLRIIDASIFPDISRAGMFFPVMMVAEKMADQIRRERRQ